jgi:hypothetical protein
MPLKPCSRPDCVFYCEYTISAPAGFRPVAGSPQLVQHNLMRICNYCEHFRRFDFYAKKKEK